MKNDIDFRDYFSIQNGDENHIVTETAGTKPATQHKKVTSEPANQWVERQKTSNAP